MPVRHKDINLNTLKVLNDAKEKHRNGQNKK